MDFDDLSRPLRDEEYPDEDTMDEHSFEQQCPECGQWIYDDVDVCPHCGMFIVADTRPLAGRPLWWLLLGLLGIVAVVIAFTLAI